MESCCLPADGTRGRTIHVADALSQVRHKTDSIDSGNVVVVVNKPLEARDVKCDRNKLPVDSEMCEI